MDSLSVEELVVIGSRMGMIMVGETFAVQSSLRIEVSSMKKSINMYESVEWMFFRYFDVRAIDRGNECESPHIHYSIQVIEYI